MNPPNGILVAQALQHLHWAQLHLENDALVDASVSIATAVSVLEKMEGL